MRRIAGGCFPDVAGTRIACAATLPSFPASPASPASPTSPTSPTSPSSSRSVEPAGMTRTKTKKPHPFPVRPRVMQYGARC
ncbi:hypothetical protein DF021_33695 [Burkholderia stagnalis]|nr:hypothetical protein DF021_33695 [Burkholderia stagnalis]